MSNDYYNTSGWPVTLSFGASVSGRSEMASIAAGFDKLAALTGNGSKFIRVNSGATAQEAVAAFGSGNVALGEEGTWTPDLTFVTPGTQTFVKDPSSFGVYTKIGTRVFCDMFLYYTTFTWTGASGSAKITGLPYAVSATNGSSGTLGTSGNTLNALYRGIFSNMSLGNTYFLLYKQLSASDGPMDTTDFPSGLSYLFIRASFSYTV